MNERLHAEPRGEAWVLRLEPAPAPLDAAERQRMDAAQARGRAGVLAAWSALAGASDAWRLEWGKCALGDGEVAMGFAEEVADACVRRPAEAHTARAPAGCLSLDATARALRARGLRVAAAAGGVRARFVLACVAAFAAWVATLLRTLGEGRAVPAAKLVLAVHGETSTRTRHVLALRRECADAPVLLLGRPRGSGRALAKAWAGDAPLAWSRPFDLRAALASLPRALALLREGGRLAAAQPWSPPFAALAAMAYRVVLGAASAHWWTRTRPRVGTVVFGHTGLADTTLLERAMQAQGTRTIHAVHGVSAGLNFAGVSSLALLRCAHDARWHARLGGYGACRAVAAPAPPRREPGPPVLFVGNLLHPMNLGYRAAGAAPEIEAMRATADALDALGDAAPRYWKPHPVHARLPAAEVAAATAAAAALGFARWPGAAALDSAGPLRAVCTTSTVALDLLAAGHLPIVLATQALDPAAALAGWPLLATDPATLTAALRRLADPAAAAAAWAAAWDRIGPAPALDLAALDPPDGAHA